MLFLLLLLHMDKKKVLLTMILIKKKQLLIFFAFLVTIFSCNASQGFLNQLTKHKTLVGTGTGIGVTGIGIKLIISALSKTRQTKCFKNAQFYVETSNKRFLQEKDESQKTKDYGTPANFISFMLTRQPYEYENSEEFETFKKPSQELRAKRQSEQGIFSIINCMKNVLQEKDFNNFLINFNSNANQWKNITDWESAHNIIEKELNELNDAIAKTKVVHDSIKKKLIVGEWLFKLGLGFTAVVISSKIIQSLMKKITR
jgi:hypothetical protein